MPKCYKIELSKEEREKLERWTRNPPQPYLRYRAQAILRVAAGEPIYKVAPSLRVRVHRNAVSDWVRRYLAEGIEGLKVKPGRGRKPAFSPSGAGGSGCTD